MVANFVRLDCDLVIAGIQWNLSIAPYLKTWLNATQGTGSVKTRAQNQIITWFIRWTLENPPHNLAALSGFDWARDIEPNIREVERFEAKPRAASTRSRARRVAKQLDPVTGLPGPNSPLWSPSQHPSITEDGVEGCTCPNTCYVPGHR